MLRSISHRHLSTAAALFVAMLASVALAACGSSSKSSSSTSASSSTTATRPPGLKGTSSTNAAARFAAIRVCLSRNGVTLPPRPKPGQRRSPGSTGAIPGLHLPKGMTPAQYQAIVKKCGFRVSPKGFGGRGGFLTSAAGKRALAQFVACMRENGVSVPAPNTSGSGPVFSSKGLDTSSPKFQAAETKCRGHLRGAFRASPGVRSAAPG